MRYLNSQTDAPLMSDVAINGERNSNSRRQSKVRRLQSYLIRNNHTVLDRGENTIYAPAEFPTSENPFKDATPLYNCKLVRDGSIWGYIIKDISTGRDLLKIHFHGDTTNPLSRAFRAFVHSPVRKFDVENYGLYSDLPNGAPIGLIQDVFPDNRVLFAKSTVTVPRLEMQVAATLGTKYYLAVTGIPEPVGEVTSGIIGRFAPRSESYQLILRNCTREEALLWLTFVIATDMKRRKATNRRHRGVFNI